MRRKLARWARPIRRAWTLHRELRILRGLPAGRVPERARLAALREGWGNTMWSADVDFLEAVCREAARAERPVLECGTGLTTVLLAYLAGRRGVPVWSLEQDRRWHRRLSRFLARRGLPADTLVLAPLREFGGFSWYDPPGDRLPPAFGLVVCDGPPGETPGGRYGLLPVLGPRLDGRSVILVDDAERPAEAQMLARWSREFGADVEVIPGTSGAYARVVPRLPAPESQPRSARHPDPP